MREPVTIWHNPRCRKSRETLKLLDTHDIQVIERRYLEDVPTEAEIEHVLKLLDITPMELMRKKESLFRELGIKANNFGDEALIELMAKHPILIERPIVITPTGAAIGRPPENVLSILK